MQMVKRMLVCRSKDIAQTNARLFGAFQPVVRQYNDGYIVEWQEPSDAQESAND